MSGIGSEALWEPVAGTVRCHGDVMEAVECRAISSVEAASSAVAAQ